MFWLYFFNLLETLEKNEEGNQECTIQRNWQHCVHRQKIQYRKLRSKQHRPHQKLGVNAGTCEGQAVSASYKTSTMLLI